MTATDNRIAQPSCTEIDNEKRTFHPWSYLSTSFEPVLEVASKQENSKGTIVAKGKIRCRV